jgi:hypothetical protein
MTSRLDRRTLLRTGAVAAIPAFATPDPHTDSGTLSSDDVAKWISAYLDAWRTKDAAAVVALFTPDGIYEAVPGVANETFQGSEAIRSYWTNVTSGQSDMTGRFGTPLVSGSRAMVELWVTLRAPTLNPDGDHWITFIETNVLYFTRARLCYRNVEYWNLQIGRLDPPQGWGSRN